jgi:hypothetical protein
MPGALQASVTCELGHGAPKARALGVGQVPRRLISPQLQDQAVDAPHLRLVPIDHLHVEDVPGKVAKRPDISTRKMTSSVAIAIAQRS